VDDYLLKLIKDKYPDAQVTLYMVREWKEKHGFVGKPQGKVEVTAPVKGKPTKFDITDQLKTACESLVEPLAESMLDLLPRVDPEFQEEVRNHILLSGGTSLMPGLRPALEAALEPIGGGKIQAVKDPVFAGADGGLAIALDAQDSDWDKLA
jgi:rod shape-determining protein MreB